MKSGRLFGLLNRSLATIALLVMLSVQASAAESGKNAVTISPAVQEQLQKASPEDRKELEAAINAGNKYIPYHFDGSAYIDDVTYWNRNIRPLVDRDGLKWFQSLDMQGPQEIIVDGMPSFIVDGKPLSNSAGLVVVCPQVNLISIAVGDEHYKLGWKEPYSTPLNFTNDSFELKYRAKVVGAAANTTATDAFFVPVKKDEFITTLISLDKNLKVSRVLNSYKAETMTPKLAIFGFSVYINGVGVQDSTASDKIRLKQLIQKIKVEEASVCANTEANDKQ